MKVPKPAPYYVREDGGAVFSFRIVDRTTGHAIGGFWDRRVADNVCAWFNSDYDEQPTEEG